MAIDRSTINNIALFDAKAATGVTTPMDVTGFNQITVAVTAAINSTLTFKFQGSIGKSVSSSDAPTFSSAQSATNHWDYVAAYDLQNPGTIIAGDTGVALNNDTVANNTRFYTINVSLMRWFSMEVSAYTDGSLTAWVVCSNF